VTSPLIRQEVSATVATDAHRPSAGVVTLDALSVPYGLGSVELPLNADTALEDFDPRDDARISIDASDSISGQSRSFDLGIRSRTVDHVAKTVTVECATDEALLEDYASLTIDATPQSWHTLRPIVGYVLGKIGATLSAGTPDPDMTTYFPVTNVLNNSGYRTNAAGWVFSNNNGASQGAPNRTAMDSLEVAATEPGIAWKLGVSGFTANAQAGFYNSGGNNNTPTNVNVRAGATLHARLWINCSRACTVAIGFQFLTSTGGAAGTPYGPVTAVPANTWTLVTGTVTVPGNATNLGMFCYTTAPFPTAGYDMYTAGWVVTDDERKPDQFFDGDTVDTAGYRYDWTGNPSGSPSSRTPLIDRLPEVLVWRPGTSAWDFLKPLTASAGLRLFCDEDRVWRLIDPNEYEVPGYVRLSPLNAVTGADEISRDDPEVFATGVVLRYVWEDPATSTTQTAYDVAGTPDRVVVIDYARPFPGVGAAAAILARRNGSGRTQDVSALTEWITTPGQVASISLPDAPEQQGKVSSVRFSLADDAVMSVGTRGLIDIPPGSWLAWTPVDQAWQDVADSVTWLSLPA